MGTFRVSLSSVQNRLHRDNRTTDLSVPTAMRQNFAFNAATVALPSIPSSNFVVALPLTSDFLPALGPALSLSSNRLPPYARSSPSSLDGLASIRGDRSACESWDALDDGGRRDAADGCSSQIWPDGRMSVCTLSGREWVSEVQD